MASQNAIAAHLGVSQSLVSRVLNGRAAEFGIAAETAARVLAAATKLGYQPNPVASMLLGGASKLIGVLVRSFDDPFLATILQELNRCALAAGCTLLVSGLEGEEAQRDRQIGHVQRYRPDALIVVGTTDFRGWNDALFSAGRRVVQIGLPSVDPRVLTCGIDEGAAATDLVRHLHASGHSRLAILGDRSPASTERARLLAEAGRKARRAISPDRIVLSAGADHEAGAAGARALRERFLPSDYPTAIVATGDVVALGCIQALSEQGLRVPEALAVAGYDDIPVAALVRPPLTTIRQPARALAKAAMDLATGTIPSANVRLRGELVVRESTRGPVSGARER